MAVKCQMSTKNATERYLRDVILKKVLSTAAQWHKFHGLYQLRAREKTLSRCNYPVLQIKSAVHCSP